MLKSKITKLAEELLIWACVFVGISILAIVAVRDVGRWLYKKVGGNVKR